EVSKRVNASGEAWFGPTMWNDMRVMRISLSNFRTTVDDIDRAVAAVKAALEN
ncbi:MAG: aspartate aminotransferase family protein, partial [Proteobacteria bacterium]|nr:aspartate aminotransferase family protein [Pseudomonadota bacterium]